MHQKKEVSANSVTDSKTALCQAKIKLNAQAVFNPAANSACEVFQRDTLQLTAKKERLKQLDKELKEKQYIFLKKSW